jgi:choice-of-anchor A domain-containing protein
MIGVAGAAYAACATCGSVPQSCENAWPFALPPAATTPQPNVGGCAMFEMATNKLDMSGPNNGGIQGDVCIGQNAKLTMSGSQVIYGSAYLGSGATSSIGGSNKITDGIYKADLSAYASAAISASGYYAGLGCTQSLGDLKKATTITGKGGLNVICVNKIELSGGKQVTLTGGDSDTFVVNVLGKLALSGCSGLRVGGTKPGKVLYNVVNGGEDVALSGGGNCSVIEGTVLAPGRKIKLSPGLVYGQVISQNDISLSGGASVRCKAISTPIGPTLRAFTNADTGPDHLTSVIVPTPTTQKGDVLVLFLSTSHPLDPAELGGWTRITSGTAGSSLRGQIFYRIASSLEPASYTFTYTDAIHIEATLLAYTGVNTSNPISAQAVLADGNYYTSMTSPALPGPGVGPNDLVVIGFHGRGTGEPNRVPPTVGPFNFALVGASGLAAIDASGWTETTQQSTTDPDDPDVGMSVIQKVNGMETVTEKLTTPSGVDGFEFTRVITAFALRAMP